MIRAMPIQAPQWTEFLTCSVCENNFEVRIRLPISLGCGHSVCKACLSSLQRNVCPFDQTSINVALDKLPVNTALVVLIEPEAPLQPFKKAIKHEGYAGCMQHMERLAQFLRPGHGQPLSRPMQRKLVTLINCQLMEEEGRSRAVRAARSLGERSVMELIVLHQNPQQLSANLWAAVRTRGCQFLGPAMQEEVLKLVLLALEDGSALSRKVLVMFVVQRLEPHFPQASKTSIGHVVQLLYRASCFIVTKRDSDSSLMQLREDFRTYEALRREHDAQIVQIANEAGLKIAPDQWSSLLYGDASHKSHMQSIMDKLQTPQSFVQSVQELLFALQRSGDPANLSGLRQDLDFLSSLDPSPDASYQDWIVLEQCLRSCSQVLLRLLHFVVHHPHRRSTEAGQSSACHSHYKTSMCRDLMSHGSCPRGKNCTFAHSQSEMDQYRVNKRCGRNPLNAGAQSPPLRVRCAAASTVTQSATPMPRKPPAKLSGRTPSLQPFSPSSPDTGRAMFKTQQWRFMPALSDPGRDMGHDNQLPLMQDHVDELRCHAVHSTFMNPDQAQKLQQSLATKSLSALKSRKEEILYSLEDLVGKDRAREIYLTSPEHAAAAAGAFAPLSVDGDLEAASAMWHCESAPSGIDRDACAGLRVLHSPCWQPGGLTKHDDFDFSHWVQLQPTVEDDLIPFTDTPQISRFGPISRRALRSGPTTQTQAVIEDEPTPTAVVRHSKQMARLVTGTTSLLRPHHRQGGVPPFAIATNGQVSYIAVTDSGLSVSHSAAQAAADINVQHLITPHSTATSSAAFVLDSLVAGPLAEPERMRHELEMLQKKISHLNLARMHTSCSSNAEVTGHVDEQLQLTSELQMIENTIRDREMEIKLTNLYRHNSSCTSDQRPSCYGTGDSASLGITTMAGQSSVPVPAASGLAGGGTAASVFDSSP